MKTRRSINDRFDDLVATMTRLDGELVQIDDPRDIDLLMQRAEGVSERLARLARGALAKGNELRMKGAA